MTDQPVILITGGARGIGRAIADLVVDQGASVILWDIDATALEDARTALGSAAHTEVLDISNADAVSAAQAALPLAPTHLVNNAGILGQAMPFDAMDAPEIDRVLGINLRGTLLVTSAFLRSLSTRTRMPRLSIWRRLRPSTGGSRSCRLWREQGSDAGADGGYGA